MSKSACLVAIVLLAPLAWAQEVRTGSASSLQGLRLKAPLTCSDGYVITWVAANNRFECLAPTGGGGGSSAFSAITPGTNTAALTMGSGGSLGVSGSGTINATSLGGNAAATYAPLGSPTFTGTPSLPAPTVLGGVGLSGLSTGLLKLTAGVPSTGAAADVIGLWGGTCNASTVLAGNGNCAAVSSSVATQIATSLNGAASTPPITATGTWFTGGSTTTTKPHLLIEPAGTTSTTWSTSGTGLGINAPSGFVGYVIQAMLNNAWVFRVDRTGLVEAPTFRGTAGGSPWFNVGNGTTAMKDVQFLSWANSASSIGTIDTGIVRNAAGVVGVNDGATAANYRDIRFRSTQYGTQAEPTCNSTNRGYVVMVQGGAGVADTFRICAKDVADAYGYVALF